jgi:hypothetical protein
MMIELILEQFKFPKTNMDKTIEEIEKDMLVEFREKSADYINGKLSPLTFDIWFMNQLSRVQAETRENLVDEVGGMAQSAEMLFNRLDPWRKEWSKAHVDQSLVWPDTLAMLEWKMEQVKKETRDEMVDDIRKKIEKIRNELLVERKRYHDNGSLDVQRNYEIELRGVNRCYESITTSPDTGGTAGA